MTVYNLYIQPERINMPTINEQFEAGDLDEAYAEYIMKHCAGDRSISNGDTLLNAMEDGYLSTDFIQEQEEFVQKQTKNKKNKP